MRIALFFLLFILNTEVHAFSLEKALPSQNLPINTNTDDLCEVANSTEQYLQLGNAYDKSTIHTNAFKQFGISQHDIMQTLRFICQITNEDEHLENKRLHSLDFLQQHFNFYQFKPDTLHAKALSNNKPLLKNLPNERILMTKYYVHEANVSSIKTDKMPYALYQIPDDELHLTLAQAQAHKNALARFKYTKQAVLQGAVEKLAQPLVYVSRDDLESALLQGTLVANQHGEKKVFNVHRNNGIAYDRNIKPMQQGRYWYFKQVAGILGYGLDANHKITVLPEVTFAGDIFQLGLGHLMMAQFDFKSHSEFRLAILADTGGAFENNLYQLDYLAGSYPGIEAYRNANRHLPDYIMAWFLIKKDTQ